LRWRYRRAISMRPVTLSAVTRSNLPRLSI
jgi:hypothetical protein